MAYDFFDGYVVTENKNPTGKYKNPKDRLTLDVAQRADEYAGVLAYDTAIVDVDDADEAELCYKIICDLDIKCRVVKTTRGMHFYFLNTNLREKNISAHMRSAIGLTVDYRVGCKKTASVAVLKQNGKMREIIRDTERPDELPCWLLTVGKSGGSWRLTEGEGRNDLLYRHTKLLARQGFKDDEIVQTCYLINKYVFADALPDDEMETITRQQVDVIPDFRGPKGQFLHYEFAMHCAHVFDACMIDGRLRMKDGLVYRADDRAVEAKMYDVDTTLSSTQRNEVLKDLSLRAPKKQRSPARYIAFANGVVDLLTGRLLDERESKDLVILNRIPHAYNPHAFSKDVDDLLYNVSCGDGEIETLIIEMIGACMYADNRLGGGKAFILTGEGANGKSTLLDLLQDLIGKDENVTTLDLKKLSDRFSTTMLENKLCDIGDDISSEFLADTSYFKRIVTGQTLDAEEKGKPKYTFTPYCKLIFSVNDIPRMGTAVERNAIIRRMVIIPFNAHFAQGQAGFDPNIGDKLKASEASYEYLINLAVDALQRVYNNKGFSKSAAVDAMLEDYKRVIDPMVEFFEESQREDFVGRRTSECFGEYELWCVQNGYSKVSRNKFTRSVNRQYKLKSVVKNGIRLFNEVYDDE